MVNNAQEIARLENIIQDNPDIKIYPLDFYVQKIASLYALAGAITPQDYRWEWIENDGKKVKNEMCRSINQLIGNFEGIEVSIIEGGSLGLPDLEKRKWLEEDRKRGGMLLDLGTHALTPLFVAKIAAKDIKVETANPYVLGTNRKLFIPAERQQPEIYADALLSLTKDGRRIPIKLSLGKTFQDGGVWRLTIRGSKGDISMGLRTGQHLTVQANEGQDMKLSLLKGMDTYELAFQEAHMYFPNRLKSEDILQPMLDAITVIDAIKTY